MSMTAFEIFGVLKLDSQQFDKGLNAAKSALGGGIATAAKVGAAAVAAATTAVVGFGAQSVKVGQTFDASMSKVAALSGATGRDFDALRDKAKDLGASTQFSASQVADAMGYMGMSGWKTEDMLAGVDGVLNLAAASGEDLATTSDIVTDALTAFGMTAKDSAEFADTLAAAATNANTNVGMMGETFKYFAPLAGTFGYNAKDTALAIGLMANSGIKASQAGTSLRGAFSRLVKPPKQAAMALSELGLMVDGNNLLLQKEDGSLRSLSEVMGVLRSTVGKLDQAEKARIATQLFGQEAMSGMLAIVNASEDDYIKLQQAIENSDGAAANMAKNMNDNLQGAMFTLTSAIEAAHIAVSDKLTPTVTEFVKFGAEAIQEFAKAFDKGGLSAAMDTFGVYLSKLVTMASKYIPQIVRAGAKLLGAFVKGIADNSGLLVKVAGEIGGILIDELTRALKDIPRKLAGIDWKGASEQMLENLKGAIGALSGEEGLINIASDIILALMRGLTEAAPALVESAAFILDTLLTGISNAAPDYFLVASDQIGKFAESIGAAATELIPHAVETLIDVFIAAMENIDTLIEAGEALINGLWNGILASLPILKERAPEILDSLTTAIMEHPEAFAVLTLWLTGAFKKAVDLALSPLRTLGSVLNSALSNAISRGFTALRTVIGNALAPIRTQIATIVSSWGSALSSGLSALRTALSSALSSAAAFATADMGAVLAGGGVAAVGMMVAAIVGSIAAAFGGAEIGKKIGAAIFPDDAELYEHYSGISGTLEMLKDTVIGAWDLITIGAEGLRDKIVAKWEEIKVSTTTTWGDVSVATQTAWDAVKNKIGTAVEEAWAKAVEKWNAIKSSTEEAWNKVKETTERIWGNISKFLKENIFTKLAKAAFDWGKDMIGNFVDGIKKKWGELKKGLGDLAEKVSDYIGFSEPKEGPLSNFHTYAPDMIDLFSEGIKGNSGRLLDSVRDAFDFEDAVAAPTMPDLNNFVPITAGRNVDGEFSRDLTVILELDRTQLAKAVYKLNNDETQRIGTRLARGFA